MEHSMQKTTLRLSAGAQEDLRRAAELIRQGGLVALPTETVYGLGANGLDPDAVAQIFAAKGRPQDNPLILHIAEPAELSRYCREVPPQAWTLAERFWPGPLTMVLPVREIVPKTTTAGLDTVAVRCPQTPATREIIRLAGVPIAAPSANLSGKPSTTTAEHVLHDMDGRIDAVVDGGPCRVGVESTIVDLTGQTPRLLRPGGVTPEQLRQVLGSLEIDRAVTAQIADDEVVRAPGMKYRHYAPQADVLIVNGTAKHAARYVRLRFSPGDAVLCFEEELPLYEGLSPIAYGRLAEPESLSAGLFAALRSLDRPELRRIFARCPEGGGISYAVQNRLRKSAGFRSVDADAAQGAALRVIGITGPSGSGKTTALEILRSLGACTLDCDAIYHGLLQSDAALLRAIEAEFPGSVRNGTLDRKALAGIVFSAPEALNALNRITHPAVCREVTRRLLETDAACAGIDAIALFESGLNLLCDVTVAVTAPEERRIRRLTERDGLSEEAARARIAAQKPTEAFCAQCDVVLANDGTFSEFKKRCEQTMKSIMNAE